jgi:hypothetical protein
MNLKDFKSSLALSAMPSELSKSLQALWYDAKGNWDRAHDIAQEMHNTEGSWIHAYLHRKEGDEGNAAYWYHRANKPVCKTSLQDEWEHIVVTVLAQDS